MNISFVPVHVERNGAFQLPASIERVFPLFTPLGEKHWAQGWNPQSYYPVSGLPEVGAVFLTSHGDEAATIWVMTHYIPEEGLIAYTRTTPDVAAGTVAVQCSATTSQMTTVQVTYQMTALSASGNAYVITFAPDHDPQWIAAWESAILYYLQHGHPQPHS